MTISTTTILNSYSGNGSTTSFAYTFPINTTSEITVIERSATGTETVKSEGTGSTNYGIADNGASGGTITMVTAPASGTTLLIRRNTDFTQETDYVANDPFPAETHEDALDKLQMQNQELEEELNRSLKISRTNTMTSTEFTTSASDRASKILAFDSSGELSVTQELGTFKGTDATTTTSAYVQRDIIKSTTTAQLINVYICVADSVVGDVLTDTDHFALLVDAVSAATSATTATTKATAAATSATASATSATASANSATAAASSASTASTQASNASTSASTASTQASNASTSATNAASSATSAASSATSATSSASTATTKASEASTSATNAASSATAASSSASTATTKASEASTSATNAASSASTASTQATNAASSATAAATAQAAAEAAADNFDDTYLGAKSSLPSVDNDGDALTTGDLVFLTTDNSLYVWTGSAWQKAAADTTSFVTKGFSTAMSIAL